MEPIFFVFPLPGRADAILYFGWTKNLKVFDDRWDFFQIVQRELLPLVGNVIAFRVDHTQNEMARVMIYEYSVFFLLSR